MYQVNEYIRSWNARDHCADEVMGGGGGTGLGSIFTLKLQHFLSVHVSQKQLKQV